MRWIVGLMAFAALAGCMETNDHAGDGSVSIYVKDAATDTFDEIHVVFHDVTVHKAGNESWMTVYENETGLDVDLLDLNGSRAAFLGEANLTAGKYTQIRINASSAYGVIDGERVEIELANSKLKVVRSFNVTAGGETRVVLDFDLDKSVHERGQKGWKMTPVIGKTFVHEVEGDQSGAEVHEEGEVSTLDGLDA